MKGLGLKLLKIHLLFLEFLPIFIDRTIDGKNGTKTRENPVLPGHNKNMRSMVLSPGGGGGPWAATFTGLHQLETWAQPTCEACCER